MVERCRSSPSRCSARPGSPRSTCGGSTSTAGRPRRCWSSTCDGWSPRARRSCTRTTRASTRSRTRTGSHTAYYPAELAATDLIVGALLDALPADTALLVTADHGQVQVGPDGWLGLQPLDPMVETYAGDGRFRYLHARPGRRGRPVHGGVGAPRRGRVGVPARTAARRGVARARPGVGHVPARRRRRARGARPASASSIRRCPTRRSSSPPTDRSPRRRCWCRWSPHADEQPTAARANVGELHPCDSSTALWRGLWTRERTSGSNVGQVVRAPPSPHRVLDARRCGPHPGGGRDGGGRRPTRRRHHRPREHVRRPRLLPRGAGGRPHAGDRHRGLHGHDQPARPAAARPARHLPPHVAGGVDAGLPQPHQGVVARVPRRVLPEAAGRLRAARAAPRGPRRHHRLPRRRGLAGDPAGRLPARPAARRPLPVDLRARLVLRGAAGPRPARAAAGEPAAHPAGARHASAAPRHQRLALHAPRRRRGARRAALRADGRRARRPQALQVRRRRVLPEDRAGDARPLLRLRGGVRQHAARRRAGRRRDRVRQLGAAHVPDAAGARRGLVPPRALHRGRQGPLRDLARSRGARAHRVRARRHQDHGVLGVLPRRVGPRALRAHARASGSVRGGGARRARASRTASASSTSTRSGTTCCSSASSTRGASRCPTSTWTSTPATAAR